VDGVLLTGGLACSAAIVAALRKKVAFLAPLMVRPGEFEIEALIEAVLPVMNGAEQAKLYQGEDHEDRR
jgi:butyrate kinase